MGRRFRRKVGVRVGPVEVFYEWTGFRDGGTTANLDTSVTLEMFPPSGASAVGDPEFTVRRIIGTLQFLHQSSIVSKDRFGVIIGVRGVGADQVIDESFVPLSTDPDAFNNKGVMWWQTWGALPHGTSAADSDVLAVTVPIDIKVMRKLRPRETLVVTATASSTGRITMAANLRALLTRRP